MSDQVNLIKAVNQALDDAMAADDSLLLLGEDIADREGGGVIGVTKGLSTKYGDKRVRSTPISEQAIIGAAIGAAVAGHKVVAELMFMNFTTVAMDMIVNHAAKLRFMSGGQTSVPIVIRMMTGTGFATGGQHSDYLEAWFAHVGGVKVVAPSNPADAYGLLLSCIEDPDPCIFVENLPLYYVPGEAAETGARVPIGKARIAAEGTDVTIVAHSRMVVEALQAAEALTGEVSVEVVDLRSISPWDREAVVASVRKTGRALIVHEANRNFGIGGEIAAEIGEALFGVLKAPVARLGGAQCAVPFSKPLEDAFAPSRDAIASAARALMQTR